jgi:hypothetical protein
VSLDGKSIDEFLSITRDADGHQQASEEDVKFCLHSFSFLWVNDSVKSVSCYQFDGLINDFKIEIQS